MKLKNILSSVTLILLGGYFLFLKFTNSLIFYIRPAQEFFTLSMGVFLIISGVWTFFASENAEGSERVGFNKIVIPLGILFVAVGIVLPNRSLTSNTVARRDSNQNINTGAVKTNSAQNLGSPLLEKVDSANYTVADWVNLFQINPDPDSYSGREVSLDGFIMPTPDGNFKISRILFACCIVDAYPIGVYVDHSFNGFKADDWVRVKGKFKVKEVNGEKIVAVEVSTIEKIPDPKNPYI